MTRESKALLEVTGLSVGFRTPHGLVHALRDVSLSVPRRRVMGIVGESGSGKSTLVWAVSRLLASNAVVRGGAIRVGETDVLGLDEAALQQFRGGQVSIVFQDPMTSQIPVLSYLQQMLDVQRRLRDRPVPERRRRANRLDPERRDPGPDGEGRAVSVPVLGGDAPARGNRDGAPPRAAARLSG